jgi:hypothetical protein
MLMLLMPVLVLVLMLLMPPPPMLLPTGSPIRFSASLLTQPARTLSPTPGRHRTNPLQ